MSGLMILLGVVFAIVIVSGAFRLENTAIRGAAGVFALVVLLFFITLSSFRHVGQDEVGIVVKNLGAQLPSGSIIAVNGEMGPQAEILGPGWHPWLWPGLYEIDYKAITTIKSDEVGLITAADGQPLPQGMAFAPEWAEEEFGDMQKAEYFLGAGGGHKGPQSSVLSPGDYRINTKLFHIERVAVTNIEKATVGVVKSNVGDPPESEVIGESQLVNIGQRGIWKTPYMPQKLYLNTKAYEVTMISTHQQIIRYGIGGTADEIEIEVRTSDGFTFPVDVRVEYQIKPEDAPLVVAELINDGKPLLKRLASTLRGIFRNNAEKVKALDYVQERSHQEESTTTTLQEEMAKVGVTIMAVRIGSIGDEKSLGSLLKTQTDREIALQEQITFQEQERAAEQQKALSRTKQEAEEEKRLATEEYEKKMESVRAERVVIEAQGEAEAIAIRARAQAEAYAVIAKEIGPGNAALIEILKIIGAQGINITPRVMITGGANGSGGSASIGTDAQTTALIGTMLDTMISKGDKE